MPVEIKELVIRMVGTAPQSTNTDVSPPNQDVLVAACVKEVLKILEKKQKR